MNLSESVLDAFEGPGVIRALPGYVRRISQVEMAARVASIAEWGGVAMLEAGTGVGKSLAYLVPAVMSGRKCVVSTATIALQDQLLEKDIPAAAEIAGVSVEAALLKGRGNYLCRRKTALPGERVPEWFRTWARDTPDGDLGGAPLEIPPDLRPRMAGDVLDCLGTMCPMFQECFYFRARSEARKASVLVVNHHLLLCGLAAGDLVPEAGLLVVDEAHQLPEAAGQCLGDTLSQPMLDPVIDAVAGSSLPHERKEELLARVRTAASIIETITGAGAGLEEYPLAAMLQEFDGLMNICSALGESLSGREDTAGGAQAALTIAQAARRMAEMEGSDWCVFTEKTGRHQILRGVPLEPGGVLSALVWGSFPGSVLTSATLSVAGNFDYYSERLGVPPETMQEIFPSPFDYPSQAVLAIPEDLPPRDDHKALSEYAWKVASRLASIYRGRTMALFTSYRNLELALAAALSRPVPGIRVMAQGTMSRSAILDSFRENPEAVILGTGSFWEGIDLAGDLLQGLVIDRIPFPSPGHPLMRARMNYLEARGQSSFTSLMLPMAAIRLRQGAGRLIRSSSDHGVLIILDGKLESGYGKILQQSLPPFRRTGLSGAFAFAEEHAARAGVSGMEAKG